MKARQGIPRRERASVREERALSVATRLAEAYPDATCELDFRNPFELLVATILSAQCTDKMVNQVTPALFEEFPDPRSLSRAPKARVERIIRKTGFYSQKTRSVRECSKQIVERFGGTVPRTIEALTTLQGVGRKTASVVVGTAFGEPAVFVDTHVKRVSYRLGLSRSTDPEQVERDLKEVLPSMQWTAFCHRLIHHGRRVCFARNPRCGECPVLDLCPQLGVQASERR